MTHKLLEITSFPIQIVTLTGLHIGGNKGFTRIGDIDNPVIKIGYNEREDEPYIPGTSLKGKLRSLLELTEGYIDEEGEPHQFEREKCVVNNKIQCPVCKYFGPHIKGQSRQDVLKDLLAITRLVFHDLFLSEKDRQLFREYSMDPNKHFYEEKIEIVHNRLGGSPNPRTVERVPPGVQFEGEIMLKIFEEDLEGKDIETYISEVRQFLQKLFDLLNKDYLGGHGSRGYGAIEISFKEE